MFRRRRSEPAPAPEVDKTDAELFASQAAVIASMALLLGLMR